MAAKFEIYKGKSGEVIRITTHLAAIPDWLKINNSITIPLPLKVPRNWQKGS